MMAALLPPNETFEAYFRRADLDQDGRISGSEAVAFFQGSNLPQPVLAQIWKYSDQNNNGFLGRPEFFNALRLATVAQSGRQLTPDIVKAALYGPAASKIPAPQINPSHGAATFRSSTSTLRPQMGTPLPASTHIGASVATGSQNAVPRAVLPTVNVNQQMIPTSSSYFARPLPPTPVEAVSFSARPQVSSSASIAADWLGMNSGAPVVGASLGLTQNIVPSTIQAAPTSSPAIIMDSKDSKALVVSGNGYPSSSAFGGDAFSATSEAKQDGLSASLSPATAAFKGSRIGAPDSSHNSAIHSFVHDQSSSAQSIVHKIPLDSVKATLTPDSIMQSAGIPNSGNRQQTAWPKISQIDIQKYTKVFVEVDKDRDGKITGEQARNLFLSWRLPREVLKQVWDLSDQDNDSMLSFREFCIALYLMERHREGRPLPALLPDVLRFDETLIQAAGLPPSSYGLLRQEVSGPHPSAPVTSITGMRPPLQSAVHFQGDGLGHASQQRLMTPFPGNMANQQNEQQALEKADGQKKPKEAENKILDSREKIEYYRTTMQELVLYKSRCDNKLNEISERASSDKREAESLAKKYEEKYKQVAEVASKLTVEEATFRDIQGRKSELQNAIANMEKGGSSDGLLQVRADRIQSDLEELAKALHERCKHHGLDIMSKATIQVPFGWQPGIPEGAIDWDEDWDKFEDEGFSIAKGLSVVQNDALSSPSKVPSAWIDENSTVSPAASISHPFSTDERISSAGGQFPEGESVYDQSEYESVRSPPGRSVFETSSRDNSPRDKDDHSHGDAESMFSGDKFADEPNWGAVFDTNDEEVDSVWGFSTKEDHHEKATENSFFASEDFGTNHINVDSPDTIKKSPFFDSVPGTPQFKSNSSPRFSEETEDRTFNDFSRFDSFSTHGSIFSPKRGGHARFDSVSSTNDFDRTRGLSLFDDTDPFSGEPFRLPESHSPRKNADSWSSF